MVATRPHPPLNTVARSPLRVDTGDLRGIARVREILATVCDPEIPVLSIADLGILRSVDWHEDRHEGRDEGRDEEQHEGRYVITITPTYIGCPAMQTIEQDIRSTLILNGITDFTIVTRLAPAWTTDWLSEQGRKKLLEFGIAPPASASHDKRSLTAGRAVIACPQCNSPDTVLLSEFGSTACKALYKCSACEEPFDYFKCL